VSGWLDRTGYAIVLAFIAGVAVAVIVFVVILRFRGDDDDEGPEAPTPTAVTTATVIATASPTAGATPTAGPSATATPGSYTDPDDALAAFVQRELGQTYIGACPEEPAGGASQGVCSVDLYRSEDLVTAIVGPPFSEGIGEAVLTLNDDGTWSIEFLLAPQDGGALSVGIEAMVFGVGTCLNFREQPRAPSGKVQSCQLDGTTGRIAEGPVQADDITWWLFEKVA
jgi:hypothetical protein